MKSEPETNIDSICHLGHKQYTVKNYDSALRLFYSAWLKIPKPQHQQADAAKVLTRIGDTYYRMGKYNPAIEALRSALACPHTDERPLAMLRLGQSLLNNGHDAQARTYLHKAYRLTGEPAFANENPKYRRAIADLVI